MSRLFIFFLLLIFNYSHSQTSDLGRFTVNVKSGCIPLEIEIISENVDSSVSVVQYDFNFNTTNNLFNPSSGKSYTYSSKGKYVVAQAINQDGVEKIDFIEIEAFEPRELDISLFNCFDKSLEIILNDNYYDGYSLFINGNKVQTIEPGSNQIDYTNYLNQNNIIEGYVIGEFNGNNVNCSKYILNISPIISSQDDIIDSIRLGNEMKNFKLFYNLEKSTNYEILVDEKRYSLFLSPAITFSEDTVIEFSNQNYNARCLKVIKLFGCDDSEIIDELCLIYLDVEEISNGIKLEFNYTNNFDSLKILRNNMLLERINNRDNIFIDNNGILKNNEYCYSVSGYADNKRSISNTLCITSSENYNPIPVPNVFTPNNDGLNDEFKPLFSIVNEYKMLIFNKYGEKIFESDDINRGWNGIYKGKIVQESYVYKISFIKDGNEVNMTGKFILIK